MRYDVKYIGNHQWTVLRCEGERTDELLHTANSSDEAYTLKRILADERIRNFTEGSRETYRIVRETLGVETVEELIKLKSERDAALAELTRVKSLLDEAVEKPEKFCPCCNSVDIGQHELHSEYKWYCENCMEQW